LLLAPDLLLADEPTGNLDSRAGTHVLKLLRDVNRADGTTIAMVTHDPSAAAVADRVVFLRDGEIVAEVPGGSTAAVAAQLAALEPAGADEPLIAGGTSAGVGAA
jgi:putative ABC transport system ATP-binding protein